MKLYPMIMSEIIAAAVSRAPLQAHDIKFKHECDDVGQMGDNRRVRLEDSPYVTRSKLGESNAAQVVKIRRIVDDLGCEGATPDEAREILALKGGDRVNF